MYSTLFLYICLLLFFMMTMSNLQKLPSYTLYGGNAVCCCSLSLLPLIYTLVAASISHLIIASYYSNELISFVILSLALALSLISTPMQTLKLSKKNGFVVVFQDQNALVLEIQNFTPAYVKDGHTYRRTPYGRFSESQNSLDAQITKFSYQQHQVFFSIAILCNL